jgi:hypothetical protein
LILLSDILNLIQSVYNNSDYWEIISSIGEEEARNLAAEWMELEDTVENYINSLK